MKYGAVIFDLFGTLVESYSTEDYQDILNQMAVILGIPSDGFKRIWSETAEKRSTGVIPTIEANLEYICKQTGINAGIDKITRANKIRYNFIAETLKPDPDVLQLLAYLKSCDFKIGLISNCSPETPLIWKETAFTNFVDVALFSSSIGLRKPDTRIYKLSAELLGIKPENCLYIGDGESGELAGAKSAGMHPVLFLSDCENVSKSRFAGHDFWDGITIRLLNDILNLLK